MTTTSPLANVIKKGHYGDYEGKNADSLIKIKEIKNLLIFQIAQYKNSSLQIKDLNIDGLTFPEKAMQISSTKDSRMLWCGPKNWLLASNKKNSIEDIEKTLGINNFAITDLSHSRTIIELEGNNLKEVLKKGCPFNFSEMHKDNCVNSQFNGITVTIDMIGQKPDRLRLFALRSFGESLFHSITDACLEFGYECK